MELSLHDTLIKRGVFQLGPISQSFSKSKSYLIQGKNGAGKSSLLLAVLGRIPITRGSVDIQGARIGCIGIENSLFDIWTVSKNIQFFSELSQTSFDPEALEPIRHYLSYRPTELSSGQKRLCEIVINLGLNFDFILLDEAFNFLDQEANLLCQNLLERAQSSGVGLIFTAHFRDQIQFSFDEVIQL